jgi:hypothetical protein
VPDGLVTTTFPDAPAPTRAEIVEEEKIEKEAAGTPPKVTEVAPVKLEPEIVTKVFVPALVGEKDVMLGA